jgi:PAS domain S-box-containing protein
MNPLAEALTGWSKEEAFGKPLAEVLRIVTAKSGQNVETLAELAMRERRILTLPEDAVAVSKSGKGSPLDDSVAPIQSHEGDVIGAVIVFRDATDRRLAEAARIEAEAKYREIFENAVVGMFQSTPDGRYLRVNRALAAMHGYRSPEEMIEATKDIAHQEHPDSALRDVFRHLLKENNIVSAFPLDVLRHDGTRLSTIVNARVVSDAEGRVAYYEGTQEDITERKSLQAQFEHAQKMEAVGRLAGGVAHDFNNILNVISGYSEIAMGKVATNHPVVSEITHIRNAAIRAARLTRQLLVFSRQQVIKPTVLDLNKIVGGLFQMLERLVGEDVTISFKPSDGLGLVVVDSGQIEQILMNLGVNARDAMPTGGKIVIQTANVNLDKEYTKQHMPVAPGPYVMLSFSDTGHGIDKHLLPKIFEPFFTTKEVGKGTGLGLATVYAIVKEGNGNIWVYSEPGIGTTFKLYFPRVGLSETPAELESQAAPKGGRETILLVEDDLRMREMVASMLEAAGYTILKPENSTAALEVAQKIDQTIDLILTDIVMPHMSGIELCDRVRVSRPGIKLLYMTGYAGGDLTRRGLLESSAAVIEKPFTSNALLASIRSVMDHNDL